VQHLGSNSFVPASIPFYAGRQMGRHHHGDNSSGHLNLLILHLISELFRENIFVVFLASHKFKIDHIIESVGIVVYFLVTKIKIFTALML
jgi:hypothetical protein